MERWVNVSSLNSDQIAALEQYLDGYSYVLANFKLPHHIHVLVMQDCSESDLPKLPHGLRYASFPED